MGAGDSAAGVEEGLEGEIVGERGWVEGVERVEGSGLKGGGRL